MSRSGTGGLLGSALVYTFTNALTAGIPFLLLPVLTRVLSPAEYGLVAMFTVMTTVLGTLTGLNVHGAVSVQYFQVDRPALARFVGSCLAVLACSSIVIGGVVLAASPWIETWTDLPAKWIAVGVVAASLQFVTTVLLALYQASEQPWKYGGLRLSQALFDGGTSVLLVIGLGLGWAGRVGGIALGAGTIGLVSLVLLFRGAWASWPGCWEDARTALRFGLPLVPHAIGAILISMADRFMITARLDAAATGVYMVALQIGMVLGLVVDSANKAYAPWLLRQLAKPAPGMEVEIVRLTYVYFAAVLFLAIVMGTGAPFVLGILVGEKFRAAAPIVGYVSVGFAFTGMYYMVSTYLFHARRTGRLALITITCGLANVVLSYYLLARNGVAGAAQAFMIAQAMLFAGTWWQAHRSHPMPWWRALTARGWRRAFSS